LQILLAFVLQSFPSKTYKYTLSLLYALIISKTVNHALAHCVNYLTTLYIMTLPYSLKNKTHR